MTCAWGALGILTAGYQPVVWVQFDVESAQNYLLIFSRDRSREVNLKKKKQNKTKQHK